MTRVTTCVMKNSVDRGRDGCQNAFMAEREHTLSVKLSALEIAKVHALAEVGDESIARYLRRVINRDYEQRFGDVRPEKPRLKPGPGRGRSSK